jgi:GNAT superfamily N-acetyltransferase
MRIEVRPARPGDATALVRIHADMGEHYADLTPELFRRPDLSGFAEVLEAELGADDPNALQLVAEVDGVVVGSLDARLLPPSEGAEHAFARDHLTPRLRIDYLATAAEHRRSGAGTALVEAAEAWGRERGAKVAEATTYHRSPLAMPFWTQRAGYAERSVNLRKEL